MDIGTGDLRLCSNHRRLTEYSPRYDMESSSLTLCWTRAPSHPRKSSRTLSPKVNRHNHPRSEGTRSMPLFADRSRGWSEIAMVIKENYSLFDGFVILHGTDSLAYTASALSFMMSDLGKPVILTGSQASIFALQSDAVDNLLGSLIIAGTFVIPEGEDRPPGFQRHSPNCLRGGQADQRQYACFSAISSSGETGQRRCRPRPLTLLTARTANP